MKSLYLILQKAQCGSKIKTVKNMPKTTLEAQYSRSMQKADPKKTRNIRKITTFSKLAKLATMQIDYSLCKMVTLGKKLKLSKTSRKQP